MYDVNGMGLRIAQKRRALGLTQEALAEKLGISAQAVSKWETGLGLPDLALLPTLAAELGTGMDELFGGSPAAAAEEPEASTVFPAHHDGLDLIHVYGRCALYASQKPQSIDKEKVTFADGSEADLVTHTAINRGKHRLHILCEDELEPEMETDQKQVKDPTLYDRYEFDLGGDAKVRLVRVKDNSSGGWEASGHEQFMKALKVEQKGNVFSAKLARYRDGITFSLFRRYSETDGTLTVYVPQEKIAELKLNVRGANRFESDVAAESSNIDVSGAGKVTLTDAGRLQLLVNGAGLLRCDSAANPTLTLTGAAKVNIGRVSGDGVCNLAGAGLVKLSGSLNRLNLTMNGAGKLTGDDLTVDVLDANMSGASFATVGRVRGESTERVAQMSKLNIRQRG